ncbi:MAG TPA: single-stranded-DNA-specific exonuclease RecJ [Anaerolineales bacterium]|nr:single-stranded-DNA-specific exonuclease RecJ [Anaerolineales bacterium]
MISTTTHWQIAPRITPDAERELHGYPPILRQILFNRGYATHKAARQYLEAQPPADTDPYNLRGIPEAVERIERALRSQERIAIYGDYDVDGVTATALLTLYLADLGANVTSHIPNRFDEGYGLNKDALTKLKEAGVNLVITVDCGIRSLEEALHARNLGLDLIITDHHHPGAELPAALAVIDPKQPGDTYPEKELAGVGLAYKLAAALDRQLENTRHPAENYLDLVALGTVADLAPLTGENRFLVRRGLEQMRSPQRQGLFSLMGVSGVTPQRITASDIGFRLGPRLNAAGRLDDAKAALDLLTTRNVFQAGQLAQQLEIQNRQRQKITRTIQEQAETLALTDTPDAWLLFAVHPEFNAGVVGLAASRLTEKYYRPAVVGQIGETYTRASCRSIAEFHITEALDRCADLLEHHGGHAAAAGFTVRNENLYELAERLQKIAAEQLSHLDLRPSLHADLEIPLSELNPKLLEYLQWMQPTGYGNPQVIFVSRNLKPARYRTVGKDNSHLKMTVSDGNISFDAIAFRMGEWAEKMPARVDLLYRFEFNEFNGRKTLQLNVQDIKASGG